MYSYSRTVEPGPRSPHKTQSDIKYTATPEGIKSVSPAHIIYRALSNTRCTSGIGNAIARCYESRAGRMCTHSGLVYTHKYSAAVVTYVLKSIVQPDDWARLRTPKSPTWTTYSYGKTVYTSVPAASEFSTHIAFLLPRVTF